MTATAPIFGSVAPLSGAAESAAWARFAAAQDASDFHAAWLAILCAQIGRIAGAMLLLGHETQGQFAFAAAWPEGRDMRHLAPVAERALKERRGLIVGPEATPPGGGGAGAATQVGYPVEMDGVLHGAVVLELTAAGAGDLQRVLRLLHWSSAWLFERLRRHAHAEAEATRARLAMANDIVAAALEQTRPVAAAFTVVNALKLRLPCEQASLGFVEDGSVEVAAISNTATFDRKANRVRQLADAMNEVLDGDLAVVYPAAADDAAGEFAHRELARAQERAGVCSVPLIDAGHTIGVLTLERGADAPPFDAAALELCTALGLLLGPVFRLVRENDRSVLRRGRDGVVSAASALFGPGRPGVKLIAVVVFTLAAIGAFVDVPYRVVARAVLEGAVQRALAAPFDGYIAVGYVRAGDTVRTGQPLARLLDRDLRLEATRWSSEREVAQRKLRQAAASQDRPQMAMAAAQVDQAQAQLSLVEDKLARATLVAPFDGIVVQGDLSQLQGSPVEQGKVLFEVTPLNDYRVVLNVDERDIDELAVGQGGELVLAGLPHEAMHFTVVNVTPIAAPQDGRNVFRVEARLDRPGPRLRPGMEGVGKVSVGQRRMLWVWTHGLADWLRLAFWKWAP